MLCELRQNCFEFFSMHKSQMPCCNVMKKIRRETIEQFLVFRWTFVFLWEIRSFQCGQSMKIEDGGLSWNLDSFSPDALQKLFNLFLRTSPQGAVNVCLSEELF